MSRYRRSPELIAYQHPLEFLEHEYKHPLQFLDRQTPIAVPRTRFYTLLHVFTHFYTFLHFFYTLFYIRSLIPEPCKIEKSEFQNKKTDFLY